MVQSLLTSTTQCKRQFFPYSSVYVSTCATRYRNKCHPNKVQVKYLCKLSYVWSQSKVMFLIDYGHIQAIYNLYPSKLLVVTFLTLPLVYQLSEGEGTKT